MGQDNQKTAQDSRANNNGPGPSTRNEGDQGYQKVGKYSIVKLIGGGTFADVYCVRDSKGKEFAMKMIRKHSTVSISLNTFHFSY